MQDICMIQNEWWAWPNILTCTMSSSDECVQVSREIADVYGEVECI